MPLFLDARRDSAVQTKSTQAYYKRPEVAKLLIAAGADVNARMGAGDFGSATPLFVACEQGSIEVARILLDAGGDPDLAREGARFGDNKLHGLASCRLFPLTLRYFRDCQQQKEAGHGRQSRETIQGAPGSARTSNHARCLRRVQRSR